MTVLYLTCDYPYGPHEAFLTAEVSALRHLGLRLILVPRTPPRLAVHQDAARHADCTVRRPLLDGGIAASAAVMVLRHPWRVFRALALIVRSHRPSVVVRNLLVLPKALWCARLAQEEGVAHIHAQWALTTATMAMVAGEVAGIPWSFTAHRADIVANNLLALKVRRASWVRFISQSGLALAQGQGVRLAGNEAVVHMGVEMPCSPVSVPASGSHLVICPAMYLPVKGHRYLLDAVALLVARGVPIAVWLAGSGTDGLALHDAVAERGLGGIVHLKGPVPHNLLLGEYRSGRVAAVVLPSVDLGNGEHEGIPVALMEAMAHGLPVVGTKTGGISELLHDGAGLLVPPMDPEALADGIQRLLSDRALALETGRAGRCRIEEEFEIGSVARRLCQGMEVGFGRGS